MTQQITPEAFVARGQAAQAAVDKLIPRRELTMQVDEREKVALELGRKARELHDRAASLTGEANKVRAEAKKLSDRASAILRGEGLSEEEGGQLPLPLDTPPAAAGNGAGQAMRIEIQPQGQPTRSLVVLPPGPSAEDAPAGDGSDIADRDAAARARGKELGETLIQKLRRKDLGVPYHVAGDVNGDEERGFLLQLSIEAVEGAFVGTHIAPPGGPAGSPSAKAPFRAEVLPIELPNKTLWAVTHARHWTLTGRNEQGVSGPVTTYQFDELKRPEDWKPQIYDNWQAKAEALSHDDAPEHLALAGIRVYRKLDADFDDDGRGQDEWVIGERVVWCDYTREPELQHVVPTAAKEAGPTVATDVDPPKWEKWVSKVREILARNKTGVGITTIPPELEGLARQLFAVNNNPIAGANLFDFYAKDWRPLPADLVDAAQVISPGAVIATNYGSHGTVISLSKYGTAKDPEWSLTYVPPHAKPTARGKWKEKDHHFINEIKIVGGRLLHYGRDEIFVLKPASAETHNAAAADHHAKLKKEKPDAGDVVPVDEAMGKPKLTNVRYLRSPKKHAAAAKKKAAGGVKFRPQSFGQWFGTFKSVYDVEAPRKRQSLPKSDQVRDDPRVKGAFDRKKRPSDAAREFVEALSAEKARG